MNGELRAIVEHVIESAYQDGVGVALGKPNYIKRNGALADHVMQAFEKAQGVTKPSANKDLFYELCEVLGQGKQVKFTTGRANKLRLRLKSFSVEEIKTAARAIANDEFMMGDNPGGKKYGNIDYLIRNDEKLDEWLNNSTETRKVDLKSIKF